jgi:hypothetical protein
VVSLAAHRRAADVAGIDWKSAVYRKVKEEMKSNGGLTIGRMVELGRVSRSGFYRFDDENGQPGVDPTWTCATRSSGLLWSGPLTAVRASRQNCAVAVGK